MIHNYSRYRILQEFLHFPRKDFQIRELSRRTKIAQTSIINHLNALLEESLVIKEKKGIYSSFSANRENTLFKLYKKIDLLLEMNRTGLIEHINNSCMPDAIVIFGSSCKGEDIENSDIDLFIQSPEKKLDLKKYESGLHRNISLFFEEDFSKLSKELKNNIINGEVLKGYLRVF